MGAVALGEGGAVSCRTFGGVRAYIQRYVNPPVSVCPDLWGDHVSRSLSAPTSETLAEASSGSSYSLAQLDACTGLPVKFAFCWLKTSDGSLEYLYTAVCAVHHVGGACRCKHRRNGSEHHSRRCAKWNDAGRLPSSNELHASSCTSPFTVCYFSTTGPSGAAIDDSASRAVTIGYKCSFQMPPRCAAASLRSESLRRRGCSH